MVGIPDELIEAARLDGGGEFTILCKVVLLLSWPVIAVLTIFRLSLMKASTIRQYDTDWTGMMSMSLLSIIPMLLVFMFFQRYFIQGIASTGM
jgi:alpha-1,4-digalacturonate transport system permease protein